MSVWWHRNSRATDGLETIVRSRYASFRKLLSLNNECLEILAGVQEDLQYTAASRDVLGDRVTLVFDKLNQGIAELARLADRNYDRFADKVHSLHDDVEREIAKRDELPNPPVARWLSEVDQRDEHEVGGKAAALGEIRNRLMLPVPNGFVITAEAYRQFCCSQLWKQVRNLTRNLDLNDLPTLEETSARLVNLVQNLDMPRVIEVALTERARTILSADAGLAVRSSAVGEGGARTFAGQFASLLNVPLDGVIDAYREVVAGRFRARALSYRLSAGIPDVDCPIAVLCMPTVSATSSGIMYTRDPADPKSDRLWITATHGLATDIASGSSGADLFVVSRKAPHAIREQSLAHKVEQVSLRIGGGIQRQPAGDEAASQPSLSSDDLRCLAKWGVRIENHFGSPQDIEWVRDAQGRLWIVQSRSLALADHAASHSRSAIPLVPVLSGGRTIHPGRVSGPAHLVPEIKALPSTPPGAIVFLRKASPEIVEVFPRISGLVAELGNATGHAASLLREFAIPSVFQLTGAFDTIREGEEVSLDAVQPRVFRGAAWPSRNREAPLRERYREVSTDPIEDKVLTLHLLDPSALGFRPAGCRSAHDVLRYCHEKAIEAMFLLSDREIEQGSPAARHLMTAAPINMHVLDLGGGLAGNLPTRDVRPSDIVSRPFQALWRGVTHPGVKWTRDLEPTFGDIASVMASSLSSSGPIRALGERSYLMVASEYMNLNSRLAYHFTLVDACVSDVPSNNYIAFRFAGGGATRPRRNLRASFIEECLSHYGFIVDRRGDLVNAWFKKAPAKETEMNLDILGRLMASCSQLDMYMTDTAVARSYAQAFLDGNYSLHADFLPLPAGEVVGS